MPSANSDLIRLRGTEQYARFLARLIAKVQESGARGVDTPHQLAEYALAVLGLQHGLQAPPRARATGRPSKDTMYLG